MAKRKLIELIAPLVLAQERLYDIALSASAAVIGIHVLANHGNIGDLLRPMSREPEALSEQFVEDLVNDAQKEMERNYSGVLSTSVIGCWAALETGIRDFSVSWLEHHPDIKQHDRIRAIKVSISVFDTMTASGRAAFIIDELERSWNATQKRGIGRFEQLLSVFNLGSYEITDEIQRTMVEFYAVRNLYAHKLGAIDERFLVECAWLRGSYEVGDYLPVSHGDLRRYVHAANDYIGTVIKRVLLSRAKN